MNQLRLPIVTFVEFKDLTKRIDQVAADRRSAPGCWTRGRATRLMNRCREHGIDHIWVLMLYPLDIFVGLRNCGEETMKLADEILLSVGGEFRQFPQLTDALVAVTEAASYKDNGGYIGFPQVVMSLAGIGAWARNPVIIAELANRGLRPKMPLEELFVFSPLK